MIKKPVKNIYKIASLLRRKYRDYAHLNRKNPLEELFFILLSIRSTEKVYLKIFRAFRKKYPRFSDIQKAPVSEIQKIIQPGGKQHNKSKAIKIIITKIINRFNKPTLAPLKYFSDKECENFLLSLPYLGKKVARCVMLYSLNRFVFPVDSHCWRVSCRLGWIRTKQKRRGPSPVEMDKLQALIPPQLRYSLHVNMISFGREICTPLNPKCHDCFIEKYCKKKGRKYN